MKVYVRGIEKTSTLYLYGTGDDEVTEKFILKLGTSPNECEIVTDELKEEIGSDVDWNHVRICFQQVRYNV